jgi:glucosamine--fructose-6-phosphate aminotransferase (isomerizing)
MTERSAITGKPPIGYTADILKQPQALRDTLAGFQVPLELFELTALPRRRRATRLVLTGMGSSYFAFYPLYYRLVEAGYAPLLVETSELVQQAAALLGPKTLVIAASQSGRSAEILRLVEMAHGKTALLGVTNTLDSPLGLGADARLLTQAGEETSVSCKTYTSMLVALELLGDLLLKGKLTHRFASMYRLPDLVEHYLDDWQENVAELVETLRDIRHLFYVGRGPSLASAGVAGLTTKESAHFHAEGMSSAAFRHGPLEMAGPDTAVVIFAGLGPALSLNRRLAEDLKGLGVHTLWVDDEDAAGALRLPFASRSEAIRGMFRPVLEILPVQMITLALSELSGHIAGEFSRATKVTTVA